MPPEFKEFNVKEKRIEMWMIAPVLILLVATAITSGSWAGQADGEESPTPTLAVLDAVVTPVPTPTPIETPEPSPTPKPLERYADIPISETERQELAKIIYLEARGESAGGQQAVAEVVLNRVISPDFPSSVHDVLYQGARGKYPQFSTIYDIDTAEPTQAQLDAINAALYGPAILPDDVVYFSRGGENDRVWGKIGGHVFCHAYQWGKSG